MTKITISEISGVFPCGCRWRMAVTPSYRSYGASLAWADRNPACGLYSDDRDGHGMMLADATDTVRGMLGSDAVVSILSQFGDDYVSC